MSKNIYTSEKVLPYVYLGIHRITNEFYIGYRYANKKPSHLDLGYEYFTSSKLVEPKFEEFIWTIIAEFFNKEDALLFEQNLIEENLSNPLILNQYANNKFIRKNLKHTQKTKDKISKANKGKIGKPHTEEHNQYMSSLLKEIPKPKILCHYCMKKIDIGNHNRWHGNNCKYRQLLD